MKLFLIGLLIGIAKIVPGVSGAVIAIRFNLYERIIDSILNYFKDIKKNTNFLFSIFSGVILAIVIFSKFILYLYTRYTLITKIFFSILILTGIKDIIKNSHKYYLSVFSLIITLMIFKLPFKCDLNYFFMGIIESISVIIPGISGTSIYISLGVYEKLLNLFIFFPFKPLLFFSLGFIISSIIILKVISFLFLKYKKETYALILGFLFASIILMFI